MTNSCYMEFATIQRDCISL